MKAMCILSVAVLGLVPTIMGAAAMANGAAVANRPVSVELEPMEQLQAQTTPDTTLLRPL